MVELLVSMAAGLIVVGGVTSVYVSTIKSSTDTLNQSKLNQELSTLVSVMANDIRRAGIWQTTIDYTSPQSNPFSQADNTKLTVVNQASGYTVDPFNTISWGANQTFGDCILYSYDRTTPGTTGELGNKDILGFRLSSNISVVQARSQGDASGTDNDLCTTGSWANLTDDELINIDELKFDLVDSACINTAEPNDIDDDGDGTVDNDAEANCYSVPPSSGDITTETRQVEITVTGSLAADSFVRRTVSQTVRVRNDHITVTP